MNHYETLGVAKDADEAAIKTAYRRKAKQHHPDKGGDAEEFKKVQKAYAILSDPDKRKRYDAGEDVDQRDGPSAEDRAVDLILQGFDQLLELDTIPGDPVALVLETIRATQKTTARDIGKFDDVVARMDKQEKRVRRRKKAKAGDNLWMRVIETKRQRAKMMRGKAQLYLDVLTIAAKMLEDEYESDGAEPDSPFEILRKAAGKARAFV